MLKGFKIINMTLHPDLPPDQFDIFNKLQHKMNDKYNDYNFYSLM